MAELDPGQMEIEGLLLGPGTPYTITDFNEGGKPDAQLGDRRRVREDGESFGRDYLGGRTHTFEVSVDTDDELAARDAYEDLAAAWDPEYIRDDPDASIPLRMRSSSGGITKVVYGRPRRLTPVNQVLLAVGRVDLVMDFKAKDHLLYSDQVFSETVTINPPPGGSLIPPLVEPLTSQLDAEKASGIVIGGKRRAWIVSTIHGPITNPVIEGPIIDPKTKAVKDKWRIRFNTTLDHTQEIEIDPQPWSRGVRFNGLTIPSGVISTDSPRLADMNLLPGTHQVILRGQDPTGTATMKTAWREAYSTL